MDFAGMTARLRRWCSNSRPKACWRGDRDWDDAQWTQAWELRWVGWTDDRERGWCESSQPRLRYYPEYTGPRHRGGGHPHWQDGAEAHYDRERRDEERRDRERAEQQRLERERLERERQERERADRERLEREERERQEAERNRPDAGSDKGTHDPQFGSGRGEQSGGSGDKGTHDPTPPPDKEAEPPPPPDKGTNDPKSEARPTVQACYNHD